jgi:hypothetical protein
MAQNTDRRRGLMYHFGKLKILINTKKKIHQNDDVF